MPTMETDLTLPEKIEALLAPHKRGGRLSPLDWAVLACWLEAEISPSAILEGIRRTLVNRQKMHAPRPINQLAYCAPEIYRAMQDELDAVHATYDPNAQFGGQEL